MPKASFVDFHQVRQFPQRVLATSVVFDSCFHVGLVVKWQIWFAHLLSVPGSDRNT